MGTARRALNIYRQEGLGPLAAAAAGHLKARVSGGTSSRKRVERFGGVLRPFYNLVFRIQMGRGVDVMDEDWDTLILLDACRYDDFRQVNKLGGNLSWRVSQGADSIQFIKRNFCGRKLHDTVYVTANPHVNLLDDDVFHAVIDDPVAEWDEEYRCVQPEAVTSTAIDAHQSFPEKRLIVHYMQPHDPPLGPTAKELREEFSLGGISDGEDESRSAGEDSHVRIMSAVMEGKISPERARQAYRETIKVVLDQVESLIQELDGKTVISSDHGEMFGESYPLLGELYEHYRHPRTPELCEVPWLVIEDDRREIVSDQPIQPTKTSDVDIEGQLNSLGYK